MIQIGKLQIDLEQGEIWQDGAMLHVGSRALDILALLIDADGALVSKKEIMERVWPTSCVEENNLQVHIAALRKALGEERHLIRTIPGRGYQLVQSTALAKASCKSMCRSTPYSGVIGPLACMSKLVGRDDAIGQIVTLLDELPELTLVGAGGIGKTCLANQVAHQVGDKYRNGVRFFELAAMSEAAMVLAALARSCEPAHLPTRAFGAKQIAQALADQESLIVLDNAEHVIEVVTELVALLVAWAPQLRILVTSREPLRLADEAVFRVPPLDVPAAGARADEVAACSAVQLFVCRARSMGHDFSADPQSMLLIGEICRRLDGIALAIELAAARAVALGVDCVHRLLDDRLQLLTGGHRNSLPRHQTLRATFDWSYSLLDPVSRSVFRMLGTFAGSFTLEAVCAVALDRGIQIAQVIESIGDLVDKSLLNVEFEGTLARYRLSESTRAYALDKLRDEGEAPQIGTGDGCFGPPGTVQVTIAEGLNDFAGRLLI